MRYGKADVVKGADLNGRIVLDVAVGYTQYGKETLYVYVEYRYRGEPEDIRPLFCSIETFLKAVN